MAWQAARCVARWDGERADRPVPVAGAVVRPAARQSRRAYIPEVNGPITTAALTRLVAERVGAGAVVLALHESATRPLADIPSGQSDSITGGRSGGGIDDDELADRRAAGARPARLGPTVRADLHRRGGGTEPSACSRTVGDTVPRTALPNRRAGLRAGRRRRGLGPVGGVCSTRFRDFHGAGRDDEFAGDLLDWRGRRPSGATPRSRGASASVDPGGHGGQPPSGRTAHRGFDLPQFEVGILQRLRRRPSTRGTDLGGRRIRSSRTVRSKAYLKPSANAHTMGRFLNPPSVRQPVGMWEADDPPVGITGAAT